MPEDSLASLDDKTIQYIYDILYDQMPDEEEETALRDPSLLPLYIKLIEDEGHPPFPFDLPLDPDTLSEIARYAIYLVGELAMPNDEKATAALLGALDHEEDRVKVGAATALGKLRAATAVEPLVALLDSMVQKDDLGGVMRLAQALGQIGDERGKASLQQFIAQRQDVDVADQQTQAVVAEVEKAIQAIDEAIA